ncbi:MAG: hypothetical protein KDD37_07400 [Bdellovibrionales bacterium]|nr:hypothetical protein [Bdellovibrionales bacterium]
MYISLLITLVFLLSSHLIYKTVRYHVEKKLSLRVVRLYDIRYFTGEVVRQIRGYFHRQLNVKNYLLSVTVLGLITFSVFTDVHYSLTGVKIFEVQPFFLICIITMLGILLLEKNERVRSLLHLNPILLVTIALASTGISQPLIEKSKGAFEVLVGAMFLLLGIFVGVLSSEFIQKETVKNYYHKLIYNLFQISLFTHVYTYLLRTIDDVMIKLSLIWGLSVLSCLTLTAILYAAPIIKAQDLSQKAARMIFWALIVFQASLIFGVR